MIQFILVIHLLFAIAMVGAILLQRSEGGALGIGGGGGGIGGGFMSGRSAANTLTRATGILATLFFVTSMSLAIAAKHSQPRGSILDQTVPGSSESAPLIPAAPSVPLSQ